MFQSSKTSLSLQVAVFADPSKAIPMLQFFSVCACMSVITAVTVPLLLVIVTNLFFFKCRRKAVLRDRGLSFITSYIFLSVWPQPSQHST